MEMTNAMNVLEKNGIKTKLTTVNKDGKLRKAGRRMLLLSERVQSSRLSIRRILIRSATRQRCSGSQTRCWQVYRLMM